MGEHAGSEFVNAAAIVETQLPAEQFLQLLHQVEANIGRTRSVIWGPRLLDLDLLLYESQVIETTQLVVPHPSMWYRRFVLQPMNEIAEDWIHPILNQTVGELFKRISKLPLEISMHNFDASAIEEASKQLAQEFPSDAFHLTRVSSDGSHRSGAAFAMIKKNDCQTDQPHGQQPKSESDRTIRLPFGQMTQETLHQFLRDILTASLPLECCH